MIDHSKIARDLFLEGCNCSQAVFLAFSDLTGIDRELSLKISSSFGGGMGRLREVCGAFSGAIMVLGALYGYSDVKDPSLKKEHYARVQKLAEKFKAANASPLCSEGSIVCRELLGLSKGENSSPDPTPRTAEFYQKRPCPDIIAAAARILDEFIAENPVK